MENSLQSEGAPPKQQSLTQWSHHLWEALLPPSAIAIDATCGCGHDTLFLARRAKYVVAYDIQEEAIRQTEERLKEARLSNVDLRLACHTTIETPADLIVYNLGYLPGSDKSVTTELTTTMQSLEKAQGLLRPGGTISLMCYDGHASGKTETAALMDWAKSLERSTWAVYLHRLWNTESGPKTLLIQKLHRRAHNIERATDEPLALHC